MIKPAKLSCALWEYETELPWEHWEWGWAGERQRADLLDMVVLRKLKWQIFIHFCQSQKFFPHQMELVHFISNFNLFSI